jgi:hypothetical protein
MTIKAIRIIVQPIWKMFNMADQIFENPRLAELYDVFDGERDDLKPYLGIARELRGDLKKA